MNQNYLTYGLNLIQIKLHHTIKNNQKNKIEQFLLIVST